jgi:hypothetical protein
VDPVLQGQLLLYTLQVAARLEPAVWFRLLTATDWDAVVRQADFHEVGPLLFGLFSQPGVVQPPAVVMGRLASRFRRAEQETGLRFAQLADVLSAFRAEGIPAIVLKGAALAELLYEQRAFRPMADLDLMVRREHLHAAEAALVRLQFKPRREFFSDPEGFEEHSYQQVPFEHRESQVTVELHWNLAAPADGVSLDPGEFWQRARPACLAGVEAYILAPEDFLLHLCLHATVLHHLEIKLRDLYDLTLLLRQWGADLNFADLGPRLKRHGLRRCVHVMLELAQRLLAAPVDRKILHDLRDDLIEDSLITLFRDRVLRGPSTDLFPVLWRRREPGSGRYWKSYLNLPFGNEMLWGIEETGFHEQETDEGRPVRWTDGVARLVVPADCEHPPRFLLVRLWIGPKGATLRLRVNGQDLFGDQLPTGTWEKKLALPDTGRSSQVTIEVLSSTFVPRQWDGSEDDRALGVLIRELRLLGSDTPDPGTPPDRPT